MAAKYENLTIKQKLKFRISPSKIAQAAIATKVVEDRLGVFEGKDGVMAIVILIPQSDPSGGIYITNNHGFAHRFQPSELQKIVNEAKGTTVTVVYDSESIEVEKKVIVDALNYHNKFAKVCDGKLLKFLNEYPAKLNSPTLTLKQAIEAINAFGVTQQELVHAIDDPISQNEFDSHCAKFGDLYK